MSWGMHLSGLDAALDVFESIKMSWSGSTLYVAGPTVKYAVHQEEGTSKLEARPFMQPAADSVEANPVTYAAKYAGPSGITSEEAFVRALALAVQDEGKRIADEKDIRDTGQLIESISIEKIQ